MDWQDFRPLFWDVRSEDFDPSAYPEFTIARVLEYGDDRAVAWLRKLFTEEQIRAVLRTERRLTRKSANFWALVYGLSPADVAALNQAVFPTVSK